MELNHYYKDKYLKYKQKYLSLTAGSERHATKTPPSYTDVSKISNDAFIYSLGFTSSQIEYARRYPKYKALINYLIKTVTQLNQKNSKKDEIIALTKQRLDFISPLLSLLPVDIISLPGKRGNTPSSLPDILAEHGFNYTRNDKIGEGSFGYIYLDSSRKWTIKINIDTHIWTDIEEFISLDDELPFAIESFVDIVREMAYIYLFNKYQIGPQIPPPRKDKQEHSNAFFMDFINGKTAIITKRYTGDLGKCLDLIKYLPVNERLSLYEMVETRLKTILSIMLNRLHIFCSDMKPANFLADWDAEYSFSKKIPDTLEIQDIVATDFGGDWCCNLFRRPICSFLKNNQDLFFSKQGRHYLLILQYLSICVNSFTYNKATLFKDEMILLNQYCKTKEFKQFLKTLCDSQTSCDLVQPPFYYLDKCNQYLGLEIDYINNTNISNITTFLNHFLKKI